MYVTICKQRAGLGLRKSTVFYMDLPVLYIAPKLRCRYSALNNLLANPIIISHLSSNLWRIINNY